MRRSGKSSTGTWELIALSWPTAARPLATCAASPARVGTAAVGRRQRDVPAVATVVPELGRPTSVLGCGDGFGVGWRARAARLLLGRDRGPSANRRWIFEEGMTVGTPGASIPIGVYRGRGCGISAIGVYEDFIGREVQNVVDFMAEQPTSWAQFENGNLTSTADVSVWQNVLGQRQLVLGVPACCGASAGSGGTTWADEANGVNDTHWEALGNRLIGLGLGGALLRIGREFNGNWYPWQVAEGAQASYIAGYSHVVTVLRGLPGAAFQFCWNPALGVGNLTAKGTQSCYPGDRYVDEIGVDVYDWTQKNSAGTQIYPGNAAGTTTGQQQEVLDITLTKRDSLRDWYSVALHHGKPLSFPEWGLVLWKTGSSYLGGGDNAVFVRAMADLISGCSLFGWHAMWEDPWGAGVCDPDTKPGRPISAPMSRAAFLEAFGS